MRLFYNDFAGYRGLAAGAGSAGVAALGAALLEPRTFQGLPLAVLRGADVRRRAVEVRTMMGDHPPRFCCCCVGVAHQGG